MRDEQDDSKTIVDEGLTLEATGEILLYRVDALGAFTIDAKGSVGLEHQKLRGILESMVKQMNSLHQQVARAGDEITALYELVSSVRQQACRMEDRLVECEESCQHSRIQLATMEANSREKDENEVDPRTGKRRSRSLAVVSNELATEALEKISGLVQRVEAVEENVAESKAETLERSSALQATISTVEQAGAGQQEALHKFEDDLTAIGLEVRNLDESVSKTLASLAKSTDVQDLKKRMQELTTKQQSEGHILEEAQASLRRLHGVRDLAAETKKKLEEVWYNCREECRDIRSWTSRGLNEMRCSLQGLLEDCQGMVDKASDDLKESISASTEAAFRAEAGLRSKADQGQVAGLQVLMEDVHSQLPAPKQLLIGTKCLSCDRGLALGSITDKALVDLDRVQQQEKLFKEVQRSLAKSPHRQEGHRDVLEFVAVHVGSTARMAGTDGKGQFEARDVNSVSGSHRLYPINRPCSSTRPGSASTHGSVPMPPRSPPREANMLVRLSPRHPPGRVAKLRAPTRTKLTKAPEKSSGTLRDALGSSATSSVAQRTSQASEVDYEFATDFSHSVSP